MYYFLDQNENKDTALTLATDRGLTTIVKILLDHGANPNLQNTNGVTALISAAYLGKKEIVQLLLSHGADSNLKLKSGLTALAYATQQNHHEIIKLLEEKQKEFEQKSVAAQSKPTPKTKEEN